MSFAHPWALALLLVPALLLIVRRRLPRPSIRYSSLEMGAPIRRVRTAERAGETLRFLALSALILAAAGPRRPDLRTRIPVRTTAVIFVLDASGSMEDPTFVWAAGEDPISRREAARRVFELFVAGGEGPDGSRLAGRSSDRGTDLIGLVTFTVRPQTACPPTLDHTAVVDVLRRLPPPNARDTGTNIGDALAEAIERVRNTDAKDKVVVLLSDGEHNVHLQQAVDRPLRPAEAAAIAAGLGVRIHTIDTGGTPAESDTDAVTRRSDGRKVNEMIAARTGGRYFAATDGKALAAVGAEIDRLERRVMPAPVYRRYAEFAAWCALTAVGLVLLIVITESTVWRRLP